MADTMDSKSIEGNLMSVRLRPAVPFVQDQRQLSGEAESGFAGKIHRPQGHQGSTPCSGIIAKADDLASSVFAIAGWESKGIRNERRWRSVRNTGFGGALRGNPVWVARCGGEGLPAPAPKKFSSFDRVYPANWRGPAVPEKYSYPPA